MTDAADRDALLLAALGRTPYVALTTYRRSGVAVTTPVWIAPEGDALVVTTETGTGKVKRLRNDPRVRLAPCGRIGGVRPGAPSLDAVARIAGPNAEHPRAEAALRRKYGIQYRAFLVVEAFVRRRQGRPDTRVILRITLDRGA